MQHLKSEEREIGLGNRKFDLSDKNDLLTVASRIKSQTKQKKLFVDFLHSGQSLFSGVNGVQDKVIPHRRAM